MSSSFPAAQPVPVQQQPNNAGYPIPQSYAQPAIIPVQPVVTSQLVLPSLPDDVTATQQVKSLSRSVKLMYFVLLPGMYVLMLLGWQDPVCAAFVPVLFIPTAILLWRWKATEGGKAAELEIMARLYAIGMTIGSFVVLIIETVLSVCFAVLCFSDQLEKYADQISRALNGQGDSTGKTSPTDPADVLPDMEKNFGYYLFLFLISYVSAACVEEGLKYYSINRVRKYRPTARNERGYLLYALAIALGFSTIENVGYLYQACTVADGVWEVALSAFERIAISTPLHLMTSMLIAMNVIRRDVRREQIPLWQIMALPVLFHGSFDFGLMVIASLNDAMGEVAALVVTLVFTAVVLVSLLMTVFYTRRKYKIGSSEAQFQTLINQEEEDSSTNTQQSAGQQPVQYYPQYMSPDDYQRYWQSLTPDQQRALSAAQSQLTSYQQPTAVANV